MNTPTFPDQKVTQYIEQLAERLQLSIIKIEHVNNASLDRLVAKNGDSRWKWHLAKLNSPVTIGISFLFPSYICNISFSNSQSGTKSKYFFLDDYLCKYLKKYDDFNKIKQVTSERSWKQNWNVELDILEKHLATTLEKVITGEEWPDIYFDWADYVEPAALDRIYQDQKDILDQEVPGKPRNAWVYFLDYFRKK